MYALGKTFSIVWVHPRVIILFSEKCENFLSVPTTIYTYILGDRVLVKHVQLIIYILYLVIKFPWYTDLFFFSTYPTYQLSFIIFLNLFVKYICGGFLFKISCV